MTKLETQLQHLRQELSCSATVDFSSPHVKICNLATPWCGRHLQWQVLIPASSAGGPDIVFDDDSFHPLCSSAFQTPADPHPCATTPARPSSDLGLSCPMSSSSLRALLRSWPALSRRPDSLTRLVSGLMELYRTHQLRRLEAAAAGLPRLQFELSTLEVQAGVQAELQQQQASFAVPLPGVDLTRLMDVAALYGIRLNLPAHDGTVSESAKHGAAGAVAAPGPPGSGQGAGGEGGVGSDNDDVLEPLEDEPSRPPPQQHRHRPASGDPGRSSGSLPGGPGEAAGAAGTQGRSAAPQLVLLASFRLPTGAGGSGDLSDPDLSLRLPLVLAQLNSSSMAAGHSAAGAASAAGGAVSAAAAGTAPASLSSSSAATGTGGASASSFPVQLVPSFQLPLWSQHMCLAEYVPLVTERLAAQLEAHCTALASRQQVLEHLGEMLGPPLELNLVGGCALFSLAWEGSPMMASVELGPRFPTDKPTIVLQYVRQLSSADACRTYRDYPWSPRWSPREMAARIHNWLKEEMPNFMRGRPSS